MKKNFDRKRAQSDATKKKENKELLSKSQLDVEQKMLHKNMAIKQRAVNETPPMVGFNSQNLFKL